MNIAQYTESLITNEQNNGWVGSNGWIYLPTGRFGGPTFSNLENGKGYNHFFTQDHTYTFGGLLNTADISSVSLSYNGYGNLIPVNDALGWNLLGNPFSCSLDWDLIDNTLDPSIGRAIYFNTNGTFASWVNGVGTNGGSNLIPPMQGFFIKTNAIGTNVTIPASARTHSGTSRYKGGEEIIPLVRLKLEKDGKSDDAVIRLDNEATRNTDNAFDAYKFSRTAGPVCIWTNLASKDYSINAIPFPKTTVTVPVALYSRAGGSVKISATQIDGLEDYTVTLTDKVSGSTIDLKDTPDLTYESKAGIVSDRFFVTISNTTTGINDEESNDTPFNIFSSDGMFNIQTLGDSWAGKSGSIKIYDITGKLFTIDPGVYFSKDEIRQIPCRRMSGLYFVECRSGAMRYVGKVFVK